MLKIFIAFDEKDQSLGRFFLKCKEDFLFVLTMLQNFENVVYEIPSDRCHKAYVDIQIKPLSEESFLFITYTHGNESGVIATNEVFVKVEEDNSSFKNTFFYATSCLAGLNLGPDLIKNGCRAFIGYDQTIDKLIGEREPMSIKCDNAGINAFLSQEVTAFQAYEQMKAVYNQEIHRLLQFGDILTASVLINSREALIFLGDKELKKEDLVEN